MGFCGCSLAASAVVAVFFGMLESIFGVVWNALVVVLMYQPSLFVDEDTRGNGSTHSSGGNTSIIADYDGADLFFSHDKWTVLSDNIRLEKPSEHMFEVMVAALVVNILWLLTTFALAVGNAIKSRDMLKPWIGLTIIVTVADIALTVYFCFKAIKTGDEFVFTDSFYTNVYVFYAVMFSRGGIIIWIINVALCVFVAQRVREIEVGKGKSSVSKKPFTADFMPYSMNPPYDTFETESSTRTKKNFRPHIPPPDYEAPNGKKRRPSLTSEPETVTLPLSVPSSRASIAQRPISGSSYIFDDRMDTPLHRGNISASPPGLAYENRGLVMEAEGWMGIPRPTLKASSH